MKKFFLKENIFNMQYFVHQKNAKAKISYCL